MKLPVVVIFDVDGTLLGNVTSLLNFWLSIKDVLHFDSVQEKIKRCLPALIRPGITDLVNAFKKKYQHVEFFIYSAGREEWLDVVIPCLEEIIGIEFNRPLFGRSYCVIGYKMIEIVSKGILRVIKAKYRGNYTMDNIRDMVVIFDDNPAVYDDVHDYVRVIKCPCLKIKKHVNIIDEMGEAFCRDHFRHISEVCLGFKSECYEDFVSGYEKYRALWKDVEHVDEFFVKLDLDDVDKVLFHTT